MSEDPTPTESNLTAEQIAKAKLQDAAPIACHIDLRKNLGRYREPDPTPEDYAVTYVKMMLRVERRWAISHLADRLLITHERADLAIENQIHNGKLTQEGGDLLAKPLTAVADIPDYSLGLPTWFWIGLFIVGVALLSCGVWMFR